MNKDTPPDIGSTHETKAPAIFVAWISAILILAGIFWFFTQPLRTHILARAVNRVLEQSEDFRRLEGQSTNGGSSFFGMNTWFTMTGHNAHVADGMKAVVFTFIGEGTFFPCLAVLSPEGKVIEFVPLNNHGKRVISRISPGILQTYARRIEGNVL